MNIFSKKNRTRLFTLLLGGVMCASTAAGVSALVGTKTASADEYAKPETTKIETLVDSWSNLGAINQYGIKDIAINASPAWNINTTDSGMTSGNRYALAVYNKTGLNENNPVDYDGNVGIWYDMQKTKDDTNSTAKQANIGFKLMSSTITSNGGYGIISFRTKWTTGNGAMSLGMMVRTNTGYTLWNDNGKIGYWIALQESNVQIVEYNTGIAYMVKDAAYTNTPANGEDLVITYGIWQSAETARSIYLKVEKTDGTVCYENTVVDADLTSNNVTENGTFAIAKGAGSYDNMTADPVLCVGGVEKPLMDVELSESKKFDVGTNLSDVTLSNTAYALVGTEGTIAEGTNNYDVKIANYYGKATGKVGTVAITSREDYSAYSQYIEKLETLVDGRADISFSNANGSLVAGDSATYDGVWNGTGMDVGKFKMANYDDTANANGMLDYDGNIAITLDYTSAGTRYCGAAMQLNGQTAYAETNGDGYGIISFRTKYENQSKAYLSLGMMQSKGSYLLADKYCNNSYGYWIKVTTDGAINVYKYTASNT
ncbi:MAG: hypothetical protein IJW60_05475, partial [Clostridia bacterium]|nr:hypothetical protein [Clostridia bacterium]